MQQIGNYDYLRQVDTSRARRLSSFIIHPGGEPPPMQGSFVEEFRDKFDQVVRYMMGDPNVSMDDIVESLGVDEETEAFLRDQVDEVRKAAENLGDLSEQAGMDVDPYVEQALASVAEFWSSYEILQRIGLEVSRLEALEDKSRVSKAGVSDLLQQLRQDFSSSDGVLKSIYDSLLPRIERLLQSLDEF